MIGYTLHMLYTEEELEYARQRTRYPSLSPVMIDPTDPKR